VHRLAFSCKRRQLSLITRSNYDALDLIQEIEGVLFFGVAQIEVCATCKSQNELMSPGLTDAPEVYGKRGAIPLLPSQL